MSEKNSSPVPARRRLIVALAAAAVLSAVVVSAALVLPGWPARQVAEVEEPQPLTEQEVAEIKAAVEKQTGTPIRYVGLNRGGVVDVFGGRGHPAYRVKKADEGWRVIEMFHAYSA